MDTNVIIKFFQQYFSRENITFLLGLFGSAGTLGTWIVSALKNRTKISLDIKFRKCGNRSVLLYCFIQNHSKLPISINQINIINKNSVFPCRPFSVKCLETGEHIGENITNKQVYFTAKFPIHISALGCASEFIEFVIPKDVSQTFSNILIVQICTNRRKAIEMKLPFPPEGSLGEWF